jgi:hypothetical protein
MGTFRLEQPATLLRLEGPDSLRFLHGQSSQDLQRAEPCQWLRSCCLTPTARVTALVEVLVDRNGAWLVITAGDAAALRTQLDRVLFPADQVQLGDLEPVRLIESLPVEPMQPEPRWSSRGDEPIRGFWLGDNQLLLRGEESLPPDLAQQPASGPWTPKSGGSARAARPTPGSSMARPIRSSLGCHRG